MQRITGFDACLLSSVALAFAPTKLRFEVFSAAKRSGVSLRRCIVSIHYCAASMRQRSGFLFRVLSVAAMLAAVAELAAAQSLEVVRVDEDWEMVVGTPNPETDGPQVSCVLSPIGNLSSHYLVLDLNHQGMPNYVA